MTASSFAFMNRGLMGHHPKRIKQGKGIQNQEEVASSLEC